MIVKYPVPTSLETRPRYIARAAKPRADWFNDDNPLTPNIHVDGAAEVDIGLITTTGAPIMRLPYPLGFGRDEEW